MNADSSRTRHLIFLAHVWLCAPFLLYWLATPDVRDKIQPETFGKLVVVISVACLYLVGRTLLAFKHPSWLRWEYVFPPIDVLIVSYLVFTGDRDPLNATTLLYFFPLAEAAGTLNVLWSAAVAGMVLLGAGIATDWFTSADMFNTAFQYFFIAVMASLLASLARSAAALRAELAVSRDRTRIAQEMHDGVQGHLITIASQLELAQQVAAVDSERAATLAGESKDTARLAADELRFLVQRMRAPTLREGFLPALRQFAHNVTSRNEVELEFKEEGQPRRLDPEVENALFRVAQEALTNAVRHSGASKIELCVRFMEGQTQLLIEDNGCGFSEDDLKSGYHSGIEGMRARVAKLGGTFEIRATPGCGVRIDVQAPNHMKDKERKWQNEFE